MNQTDLQRELSEDGSQPRRRRPSLSGPALIAAKLEMRQRELAEQHGRAASIIDTESMAAHLNRRGIERLAAEISELETALASS